MCDLCLALGVMLGAVSFPLAWLLARLMGASYTAAAWCGIAPVLFLTVAALINLADDLVPLWVVRQIMGLH